ncbi:MAG: hypothetical protein A2845_05490 [Candidatus Lloydbacteria bacterium RIFCSPHIGHO2_01_FULL_49_22]|uniref:Thioredoxin domain-containing protein n=1 Tax=Candidatus Lloydbacteria bacterium RIFCSPHIGHO2_01_FULL_49_22 TaxID=1798658 RepID=A0A1G2CTJ0_9BACT|nr:MAG: hypothetical protein A2845_05490 [Candidatus Lloydbacteria bacterium RIFCSPHIGHO2_01_FULL_49_22]OGZ09126.1 MAG: hypothetical protein A3C14_04025 [Candidatus Lloydbacteria bacterium RIFCSPHIGHO2_02_FULL_50_18]
MEKENQTPATHHVTHTKRDDSLNIPIAIVFAGILIAGSIIFSNKTAVGTPTLAAGGVPPPAADAPVANVDVNLLKLTNDDHILGNPDADVVVIEYSDTECPFCKRLHETMLLVAGEYGTSGQVAWVYRHFPLDMHPKARKEAEALECANELGGNDAFWKYADKIFEITPGNNGLDATMLPQIAGMVGVDVAKFTTCLSSGKYAPRVQRDFENGASVGVRGTPYSIIWNRKTGKQVSMNGAYPFENVKSLLDGIIAAPSAK